MEPVCTRNLSKLSTWQINIAPFKGTFEDDVHPFHMVGYVFSFPGG